jgi:uncharacterized protein YbbC (DUF1343 family)
MRWSRPPGPHRRPGTRLSAATALAAAALVAATTAASAAPPERAGAGGDQHAGTGGRVVPGVSVLAADRYAAVAGQRVGVIANPTSVLPDLRHEVDVMAASPDIDLVAVFGPEHGFRGSAQAGGSQGFHLDQRTGLPVYDTYQKNTQQLAEIFTASGVDTVLFDIQDVGTRYYTYIWTMYDSMIGAALAGKRFVVLDRPNPVGGVAARGPVLTPEFATFVGRREISQQHGMTVGELARLFNAEFLPDVIGRQVDLHVVRMRGWSRSATYESTGLPWILPSPNMPTVDTATVYAGTGMLEGTNASEGRGTTRPFELIGAPYADYRLADELNALRLPGVTFREAYFTPTFAKHQGVECAGVQVQVTDRRAFDALRTGVAVLVALHRLYPDQFQWRFDSFDPARPYWIDKLTGSTRLRTQIDAGAGVDEVVAGWRAELAAFQAMRARYLLYPRR